MTTMQEPMTDEESTEVRQALEVASAELAKVLKIARAHMAATTDEMEAMSLGVLGQHHADELMRLFCVAAAGWLGLGTARGLAGMVDRKNATAIRNLHFLLPLLEHGPSEQPKLALTP
jgi:hypothetical protein